MTTNTYEQVININWNAEGVQGAQALTNAVNQSDASIQRLTQDAQQANGAVGALAAQLRANVGSIGGVGGNGGNTPPPNKPFSPFGALPDPSNFKRSQVDAQQTLDLWYKAEQARARVSDLNKIKPPEPPTRPTANGTDDIDKFISRTGSLVQLMAIYRAMDLAEQAVVGTTKELVEQYERLEDTGSRVQFILGQTAQQAQASVLTDIARGSQYGISGAEAASASLFRAQTGVSTKTTQDAQKASLLFGQENYANILRELYQAEKLLANSGQENVDIMGYFATALATVGTQTDNAGQMFSNYSDALQAAIPITNLFGISSERLALAIGATAFNTEKSVLEISNFYSKIGLQLGKPETVEQLKSFGIEGANAQERIKQVTEQIVALTAAGEAGKPRLEALQRVLLGGVSGQQAASYFKLIQPALAELLTQYEQAGTPLRNFDEAVNITADNFSVRVKEMGASWEAFIGSLSQQPALKGLFDTLGQTLKGGSDVLRGLSYGAGVSQELPTLNDAERKRYEEIIAQTRQDETVNNIFRQQENRNPIKDLLFGAGNPVDIALMQSIQRAALDRVYEEMRGGTGTAGAGATGVDTGVPTGFGNEAEASKYNLQSLPSQLAGKLPVGAGTEQINALVKKYDEMLKKAIPQYANEPTQDYYFFDGVRKSLDNANTPLVATNEALRLAIEELTKVEKDVKGFFNVPVGGQVWLSQQAAEAGYGQRSGASGGATQRGLTLPNGGFATPAMSNYPSSGDSIGFPMSSSKSPNYIPAGMGALHTSYPQNNNFNVTIPISVNVDGVKIQEIVGRQNYTELRQVTRGDNGGQGRGAAMM